jgi:pyrroline-5-carboxylate reductase
VTSPHGTTEAALEVFAARDFQKLVADAVTAARDRSRELSA